MKLLGLDASPPMKRATVGEAQSGRERPRSGLVPEIVSGALPVSIQVLNAASASNLLKPGLPSQWRMPGAMKSRRMSPLSGPIFAATLST